MPQERMDALEEPNASFRHWNLPFLHANKNKNVFLFFFPLPPHVESCNKRNERKKSCLQPFRKKKEFNEEVKHQYLPLYKMNIEKQLQFQLGLTKVVWILLEIQLEFLPWNTQKYSFYRFSRVWGSTKANT